MKYFHGNKGTGILFDSSATHVGGICKKGERVALDIKFHPVNKCFF